MNYEEFIQKVHSNDETLKSVHSLRNREKRMSVNGGNIPFLKKDKNKQCKLLIPIDYFETRDPLTLKETDLYNKKSEFRPEGSFTSTALNLKRYYNENPEAKKAFMEVHGIESWDTENLEQITDADIKVLKPVRDNRVFLYDTRFIKDKNVTGSEYAQPYRLNYLRGEFGEYKDAEGNDIDTPEVVKLHQVYKDIFELKYAEWEESNKNASKEKKGTKRQEIFADMPVTSERRYQVLYGLELPLDAESNVEGIDSLHTLTVDQLNNKLVIIKLTQSLEATLKSFAVKNKKRDCYADFIEIDISVGDEEKASDRGKNTQYTVASVPLNTYRDQKDTESDEEYQSKKATYEANFPKFLDNFRKLLDNQKDIETVVTRSAARRQLSDSVVTDLYKSLETTVPFEEISGYLTNQIVDKHGDVLSDIYGDNMNNTLMQAEMGMLVDKEVSEDIKSEVNEALINSVNSIELDEE